MRWAVRGTAIAAIVFSSGISGAWLGAQMHEPLPFAWGWFGAVVMAVAMFGGVALVSRGVKSGWLAVGLSVTAEVVYDYHYFAGHDLLTHIILAATPMGIALAAGWVEGAWEAVEEERKSEAERARAAREAELELERMRMEHRRELARIRAEAKAQQTPPVAPSPGGHVSGQVRTYRTRADRLEALRTVDRPITARNAAEMLGVSERQARRDLGAVGFSFRDGKWFPP